MPLNILVEQRQKSISPLEKDPETIIIHTETKDLKSNSSPEEIT